MQSHHSATLESVTLVERNLNRRAESRIITAQQQAEQLAHRLAERLLSLGIDPEQV